MSFDLARLKTLVEQIDEQETNNWEETTREERSWMQAYHALATQVLKFYGHKVSQESSEVTTNKAIAKMAGTRL